ncbi:hypothetical protein F5148DRAFT_821813 [Russula earlei]|uniref:Uncharacterized protein n=1 Tax=Russula earlei TaxID=71964 RepID=A0ACC0UBG4_9AGAM|nr:hypothetical protein F5148DRAFT_821813 [Russula earlei]
MRSSAIVAFICLAFGVAPSISVRTNPSRRSLNPHGQGGTPFDSHRGDNSQGIPTFEFGDPKLKNLVTEGYPSQNEQWHKAENPQWGKSYHEISRNNDPSHLIGGKNWRDKPDRVPNRAVFHTPKKSRK